MESIRNETRRKKKRRKRKARRFRKKKIKQKKQAIKTHVTLDQTKHLIHEILYKCNCYAR